MTCGGCVAAVERALQTVPGVKCAQVNLATGTAAIELLDPSVPRSALVRAVQAAGYDADTFRSDDSARTGWQRTQDARVREQRQAVVQAVGLTLPVLVLHGLGPRIQGLEHGGHVWPHALQGLLLLLLLVSSAGGPILVSGWRALLRGTGNMDALVSLGVTTASLAGAAALVSGGADHGHFHAAAMILALINVGKYLEAGARRESTSALDSLARRIPRHALRVHGEGVQQVAVEDVRVGDRVRVAADQVVPVDGRIEAGEVAVDESALTGEFAPRFRGPGDAVAAGSLVREGIVTLTVTRVGAESSLARILRAVEAAQNGKTPMQRVADRVAGVMVPAAIALAGLTLAANVLYLGHDGWTALDRAVAVLVIACPCAMGLATPTAVVVATGAAAQRGILVRDAAALEAAGRIHEILFDKTGTLTTGTPTVRDVFVLPGGDTDGGVEQVLAVAAAVERHAQHPFARALVAEAARRGMALPDVERFHSAPGRGVYGTVAGQSVVVGSPRLLAEQGIDVTPWREVLARAGESGSSVVCMAVEGRPRGAVLMSDALRPEAREALRALRRLGVRCLLVSGDQGGAVRSVARELDINDADALAEASPEGKREEVENRRRRGRRVAFVGDGVNDGPALAAADVGITLSGATDVALGAAGITIVGEDLRRIAEAMRLARRSVRIIRQNLGWAFGYNLAAIPLAATGQVAPHWAAALMMASSLSVVLNALRLRGSSNELADRSSAG